MVVLWLREEAFWSACPLILRERRMSKLSLLKVWKVCIALKRSDEVVVRYTSWITQSWALLGWPESVARLFWECASCLANLDRRKPLASADAQASFQLPFSAVGTMLVLQLCQAHPSHSIAQGGQAAAMAPLSPMSPSRRAGFDLVWPNKAPGSPSGGSHGAGSPTAAGESYGSILHNSHAVPEDSVPSAHEATPLVSTPHQSRRLLSHAAREMEDSARLQFVKDVLPLLLRLASSDASAVAGEAEADWSALDFTLLPSDLDNLSLVLQCASENSGAPQSLSECCGALLSADAAADGALPAAAAVALLREHLGLNEVLYPSLKHVALSPPPSPRHRPKNTNAMANMGDLSVAVSDLEADAKRSPPQRASPRARTSPPKSPRSPAAHPLGAVHLALPTPSNLHSHPPEAAPHAPLVVSCLHRGTEVRVAGAGCGVRRSLHIQDCSGSYVYMLEPFRDARIWSCSECVIVVGGVAGQLYISDCEKVTVVAAARRVLVSNCLDSAFFAYTPHPPVLAGDNRAVRFAPYNADFPSLPRVLEDCGLLEGGAAAPNLWSAILDAEKMGEDGGVPRSPSVSGSFFGEDVAVSAEGLQDGGAERAMQGYHLPPQDFTPMVVPGAAGPVDGGPPRLPGDRVAAEGLIGVGAVYEGFPLPQEYADALERRTARAVGVMELMGDGRLSQEKKAELAAFVQGKFAEWIGANGHVREIVELIHLDRAAAAGST